MMAEVLPKLHGRRIRTQGSPAKRSMRHCRLRDSGSQLRDLAPARINRYCLRASGFGRTDRPCRGNSSTFVPGWCQTASQPPLQHSSPAPSQPSSPTPRRAARSVAAGSVVTSTASRVLANTAEREPHQHREDRGATDHRAGERSRTIECRLQHPDRDQHRRDRQMRPRFGRQPSGRSARPRPVRSGRGRSAQRGSEHPLQTEQGGRGQQGATAKTATSSHGSRRRSGDATVVGLGGSISGVVMVQR